MGRGIFFLVLLMVAVLRHPHTLLSLKINCPSLRFSACRLGVNYKLHSFFLAGLAKLTSIMESLPSIRCESLLLD